MIRFMYDCDRCDRADRCPDRKMLEKTEKYLIKTKHRRIGDVQHPEAMSIDIVCHCDNYYQSPRYYRTVK